MILRHFTPFIDIYVSFHIIGSLERTPDQEYPRETQCPFRKTELANRIKAAREAAGLTQAEVAGELHISRSAVAEIESGRRGVSSLEIERIAFLVGRDMREFLADEFRQDDVLTALFRAEPEALERGAVLSGLRHCLALGRELQNLERLADIERVALFGTTYNAVPPRTRWDATRQGERVAEAERQRLGLGKAQLGDITPAPGFCRDSNICVRWPA